MMKYINNDDVFEIMNEIKNKYNVEFDVDVNNDNVFFIDYVELIDDDENVDEFNYLTNNKLDNIYNYIKHNYHIILNTIENNVDKCIEINLYDPLYYKVIYNKDLIKNIFKNNIELINELYNELNEIDIKIIVENNIDNIFDISNNLSIYDLFNIFNNSLNEINDVVDVKLFYLLKLFEFVIDDIKKFVNTIYIDDKFKFDLNNKYSICNNKLININNLSYDEIYENYLLYDLNENIDDELIDVFDIDIDININDYEFFENVYLNNLSNDIVIDYNINYDNDENYLLLSIDNIFELLYKIDENELNNIKYYNLFNIDKIDDVFEMFNNSFIDNDNDEFIYNLLDNIHEILCDDQFYNKFYYYDKFDNKFDDIYDVKKYVLNYLSTLNLNKSFKFDDELYNIF